MYAAPELATWIDGKAERSAVADDAWLHDPNDGCQIQRLRSSGPEQVERAIATAARVHHEGAWESAGVAGRAEPLERFAAQLEKRAERIAVLDAVNSGVPVAVTRLFAQSLADTVRGAVRIANDRGDGTDLGAPQGPVRLRSVPWGPTALIIPWNAPSAVAVKKMAYALVAGAPVLVKPSPAAPWSAQLVAEAAAEALPGGVVSVLLGGADVGHSLCSDPRVKAISMTGSTATGQAIAAATAAHLTKLRLELGSTNPVIVRADADVAGTARSLYEGMTKLNGQWCEAPRTVFAVGDTYQDLVDVLGAMIQQARVGSSLEEGTLIGPMAFEARRDELCAQRDAFAASGRRVVAEAERPHEGWFFGPTLLSGSGFDLPGEVFGPMLTVEPVSTDVEAVTRANAVAGGLAGYVFGEDLETAISIGGRLVAGEVKVNGTSLLDMAPESAQSFFGLSGIGGHGDRDLLGFYTGKQIVGVDLVDAPL